MPGFISGLGKSRRAAEQQPSICLRMLFPHFWFSRESTATGNSAFFQCAFANGGNPVPMKKCEWRQQRPAASKQNMINTCKHIFQVQYGIHAVPVMVQDLLTSSPRPLVVIMSR